MRRSCSVKSQCLLQVHALLLCKPVLKRQSTLCLNTVINQASLSMHNCHTRAVNEHSVGQDVDAQGCVSDSHDVHLCIAYNVAPIAYISSCGVIHHFPVALFSAVIVLHQIRSSARSKTSLQMSTQSPDEHQHTPDAHVTIHMSVCSILVRMAGSD
jgi:hypothetical protein